MDTTQTLIPRDFRNRASPEKKKRNCWQKMCEENGDDGWATPNPASNFSTQTTLQKYSNLSISTQEFTVLFYSAYQVFLTRRMQRANFQCLNLAAPPPPFWLVFLNTELRRRFKRVCLTAQTWRKILCRPPPVRHWELEFFPFLLLESRINRVSQNQSISFLLAQTYAENSQKPDHLGDEYWQKWSYYYGHFR